MTDRGDGGVLWAAGLVAAAVAAAPAGSGHGEVALAPIFSDHMVLQQGMPVPIWGTAEAGEKVTVRFAGQVKTAAAGPDGHWMVQLDPLKPPGEQGGLQFVVQGVNTITLRDVLIGEVWFGCGQSNMDMSVDKYEAAQAVVGDGRHAMIRYSAGGDATATPGGGWLPVTPQTAPNAPALLMCFAIPLQKALGVPVGLVERGAGGTASRSWLSREALTGDANCAAAIRRFDATYGRRLAAWERLNAGWALYERQRRTAGRRVELLPYQLRQHMKTPPPRHVELESVGALHEKLIRPCWPLAFRGVLWDQGESGSGLPGCGQELVMPALIRSWRAEWGRAAGDGRPAEFWFLPVQKPSGGGFSLLRREREGRPMNLHPVPDEVPDTHPWQGGWEREAYQSIARLPRTALVPSLDLGGGAHPHDKDQYGRRAADVALGLAYGRRVAHSGPRLSRMTVEGRRIRLHFTHTTGGLLAAGGGELQGFLIAGDDRRFVWAKARIDHPPGSDASAATVLVWSDAVASPVAVRYAWDHEPKWANLFNGAGLPALTFRTDTWERQP